MANLRNSGLLRFGSGLGGKLRVTKAAGVLFVFCLVAAMTSAAQGFNNLVSFDGSDGTGPLTSGSLIQATNGNLYGTTQHGGTYGYGTVFEISTTGTLTTLYSFCSQTGCTDGEEPTAGLVQASNGNFYGTTGAGGANGSGTVFEITPAGNLSTLYSFCSQTGCIDGQSPSGLVLASNGSFYGTTYGGGANGYGTVFGITAAGKLTTLYSFCSKTYCTDGERPYAALVQAANGNFYGTTSVGGASNDGTVFEVTTAGKLTTLHSFAGADGYFPIAGLIQAINGNFYGTTYEGGAASDGTVFNITSAGKLTTLHSFGGTDGASPEAALVQATDGNFYGTTEIGGVNGEGTAFKITQAGKLTTLYSFCSQTGCTDGREVSAALLQDTDGSFYGTTYQGGTDDDGTVFSLSVGLNPFISLQSTSGKVGSKVGIIGQGFDSSSVVKFNGVQATSITVTGTTYITATVPTGASDGYVTVTTGATTLTSTKTFTVHNSWSSGAAMPAALGGSTAGFINGKIYVVGGFTANTVVGDNQVYAPTTNSWATAAPLPTPVYYASSAVVGGILYVIGGYTPNPQTATNLVQAYNPKTNTWSTKANMPTARGSAAAVADGTAIYVIGGNGSTLRLNTVEKFVPSTNSWTEEAPLLVGKSEPAAGLVGTTIVAADGYTTSGDTGDNEGYNVSTNTWSALTADPAPRNASCYGSVSGQLYVAGGGDNGAQQSFTDSFSVTTKKWTTQAAMPQAVIAPGSALANGLLYCFGGSNSGVAGVGSVYDNVQIYQP